MTRNTTKHFCARTECDGRTPTVYVCSCGFQSTDSKDFVDIRNPSIAKVTCEAALAALPAVVTKPEWVGLEPM